jgi:glycosyltransferase involved in cell wall biosynthesis
MNLFVDSHVFDGILQGSRTYLKELYRELILQNPSVNFFLGAYDVQTLEKEFGKHNNVRFVRYRTRNKYLRMAISIPYLILKHKIDIAHYQYISPPLKLSKEILTIHDVLFLDFPDQFPPVYRVINKLLFKWSARRADYILTVSDYERQSIAGHFRISPEDIHVIQNGVAEDFFEPVGELPDIIKRFNLEKYLLYVSRIEPRKNHVLLLKAFVELNLWKEGYNLVFIGSVTLKAPLLDNYLKDLSPEIKATVRFIDGSYGNELKSFYRNCRLFIYPSLAEGFGIPPLEAIASGVPVLCSNTTSMSDFSFLKDRLFDPGSIGDLKEKIMKYLDDEENDFHEDIEYVRKNYSWKNSAKAFGNIIFKD